MINWEKSINRIASNEKIEDLQKYLYDKRDEIESSIDTFYSERDKILRISNNFNLFEENEVLGPLLFVGIISATENYVRNIFAGCIRICPVCKKEITNHNILAGSIIWQQGQFVEKSIFENISFSDGAQIKKELKNCMKIEIKSQDLLFNLLEEYDKLCQIRHAIVHSSRVLAGKNAIKLDIPASKNELLIKVGYDELQECASICTSLVCEINTYLFKIMVYRWAIEWKRFEFWNTEKDKKAFDEIWHIFFSQKDAESSDALIGKVKCKNAIKKQYHLE